MDLRKLVMNFSIALFAQGSSLFISCLLALFVPKVLGIDEYGYWQLFIFYSSYVGFFHFGLNDGIYLLFGGKTREEIDKSSIKSQFLFVVAMQLVIAACVVVVSFFTIDDSHRMFVVAAVAFFMVTGNATSFLGYIFQAMNETKLYSFSVLVNSLAFLLPLVVLLVLRISSFEIYIVFYLVAKVISLIFCLLRSLDFLKVAFLPASKTFKRSFECMRVGIKLTLANVLNMLIVGVIQFLADWEWGIEFFGQVSLAFSMVTFFMTFISQASMVLFPALRQANKADLVAFFERTRDATNFFLPGILVLYQPFAWILTIWLPQYAFSFQLFSFLFPICVFDGKMDVVGATYLKVIRGEKALLLINFTAVVISALGSYCGIVLFHSIELAIISALIAIIWRGFFSEYLVEKKLNCGSSKTNIGLVILALIFIVSNVIVGGLLSTVFYLFAYTSFLLVNRKEVINILKSISSALK